MGETGLEAVIHYWFDALGPESWFSRDDHVDATITARFGTFHEKLAALSPTGFTAPMDTLAAIIVLDQFPRNMFRGTARAFATDALALGLGKAGIAARQDESLAPAQKAFFYMPFMHSENLDDQQRSLTLFNAPGLEGNYAFALPHKTIIERFGRFPHRNAALGRTSSADEAAFLREPGSSF